MAEFLGTKGKWIIDNEEVYINESGVLATPISIENFMIGFIDVYGDQPEDKYNALLVSKAPAMLEILKELTELKSSSFLLDELQERAKQLIKEATQL